MIHIYKGFIPALLILLPMNIFAQQQIPTISPASFPELEMVEIEGGKFIMGCNDEHDPENEPVRLPRTEHEVTLSDYKIGKYE